VRNYGAKWQKDADFNGLVFPGTSENQVIFWLRNMEKPQCWTNLSMGMDWFNKSKRNRSSVKTPHQI
jgi:hypothetical protein